MSACLLQPLDLLEVCSSRAAGLKHGPWSRLAVVLQEGRIFISSPFSAAKPYIPKSPRFRGVCNSNQTSFEQAAAQKAPPEDRS